MYPNIIGRFLKRPLRETASGISRFAHPITTFNDRAARATTYEHQHDVEAKRPSDFLSDEHKLALKYIKEATRWLPANPNKKLVKQQLSDTYVPLSTRDEIDGSVANVQGSDGKFGFDVSMEKHRFVLLSGVRGIGKTAFLNYWLTHRTKELEKANLTWFRVDASKVHKIQRARKLPVLDSYVEYMRVHTVYVVLLYGGFFQNDFGDILDTDNFSPLFKNIVNDLKFSEKRILADVFGIFKNTIKHLAPKMQSNTDFSQHIVHSIVADPNNKTRRKLITSLFQSIVNDISKRNCNFIILIDGVDNISWTKRNKFYVGTCKKFSEILRALVGEFGESSRIVVAARPETMFEIKFSPTGDLIGFNNSGRDSFKVCKLVPPGISEIVKKKLIAARDAASFDNLRSRHTQTDGIKASALTSILGELEFETNRYQKEITASVRESATQTKRTGKSDPRFSLEIREALEFESGHVLETFYDNDIRAYLDNIVKVFFVKKKMIHPRSGQNLLGRRIIQYVFLNGRPFFDSRVHYNELDGHITRANYSDRGCVFPNIFWWDQKLTRNRPGFWHALAGLRMLQILHSVRKISGGDLIHYLNSVFLYDTKVLTEIFESYLAYGLIDIEVAHREDFVFEKEIKTIPDLQNFTSVAFITKKGRFYLNYIWQRPDILYFFALDTPMHWSLVERDSRYVRACREFSSLNFIEDFFSAAIPTLTVFYAHLSEYDRDERIRISNSKQNDLMIKKLFDSKDDFIAVLELPTHATEFLSWFIRVGLSPRRDRVVVEQIKADIVGLFQK